MNQDHSISTETDSLPADRPRVPLHDLLGLQPRQMGGGRGRLELVVREHHLRTLGILHGGVFATMLDSVMGMAAQSLAPAGDGVVTAQLNVNFLRPVSLGETLTATSEVLHAGRRTAVVRGEIRTATNDLAAIGSATFMFLPPTGAAMGGIGPLDGPESH